MKVMFDTNVVLDVLQKREPHFKASLRVMELAASGRLEGIIPASALTDVYYIVQRSLRDAEKTRASIVQLTNILRVCDTRAEDAVGGLELGMTDYEDAVLACVARREKVDCIITRNTEDFYTSPVAAYSPQEFLEENSFTD